MHPTEKEPNRQAVLLAGAAAGTTAAVLASPTTGSLVMLIRSLRLRGEPGSDGDPAAVDREDDTVGKRCLR